MMTNLSNSDLNTQIGNLLEQYEVSRGETYSYTSNGINEILDTWGENKEGLIKAFESHPEYNGRYQIVLTEKFERKLDKIEFRDQIVWFRAEIYEQADDNEDLRGLWRFLSVFQNALPEENKVTSEVVRRAELELGDAPEVRLHEGQKLSKALRKLFTAKGLHQIQDFEKHYAKLADALSPIVIERPFVLSINPIDYLTMSFGLNWTSCHTIDKTDIRGDDRSNYQGCYSSGTLSYMLDGTSIVMYTLSRDDDISAPETLSKVQRQMCHYSQEAKKIIFGRIYPTSEDDQATYRQFREIAQRILSECDGIENLWNTSKGPDACRENANSHGTHYRDYTQYDVGACSKHQFKVRDLPVEIGHTPICPSCGYPHHREEAIVCNECQDDSYRCEHCGDRCDDDYFANEDGYVYCCELCAEEAGNVYTEDEGWCWERCCVYDDYEDRWYRYEDIEVIVDGYQYISTENAIEDGCFYDNYDNRWYREDPEVDVDGLQFISESNAIGYGCYYDEYAMEWFFEDPEVEIGDLKFATIKNASAYGACIDALTSEWFMPSDKSVSIDGFDYEVRDNALLDGWMEVDGEWMRVEVA